MIRFGSFKYNWIDRFYILDFIYQEHEIELVGENVEIEIEIVERKC